MSNEGRVVKKSEARLKYEKKHAAQREENLQVELRRQRKLEKRRANRSAYKPRVKTVASYYNAVKDPEKLCWVCTNCHKPLSKRGVTGIFARVEQHAAGSCQPPPPEESAQSELVENSHEEVK